METIRVSRISFVSSIVLSSLILTACGGGGGGAETAASTTTPPASSSPGNAQPPSTQPPSESLTGNAAPTISGSAPTTATVGVPYSFTPVASDKDKDQITFTISNKPAWATFATATGALTGTPGPSDVGTFANVEIAATDGKAVTALPAFTINVAPAGQNSITVAWDPPTQNDDGSALTDLKGYRIHYGSASRSYTASVSVDNPGVTSYVLESLPAGTQYIAMTAYNAAGEESDYSQEVKASFN